MAANITNIDQQLISSVIFSFRGLDLGGALSNPAAAMGAALLGPAAGAAAGAAAAAIEGAVKLYTGQILFQFPPKFNKDSRSGEWVDAQLRGGEPVANYALSGAREITMSWSYIAGARGGPNNTLFTPHLVAKQVRRLRSYFSKPYEEMMLDEPSLTVYFKMWYHTGAAQFSCRLMNVDVTYGRALVTDVDSVPRSGESVSDLRDFDPNRTYALRTDVTIELRLWTKQGAATAGTKEAQQDAAAAGAAGGVGAADKLKVGALISRVPADWQ